VVNLNVPRYNQLYQSTKYQDVLNESSIRERKKEQNKGKKERKKALKN